MLGWLGLCTIAHLADDPEDDVMADERDRIDPGTPGTRGTPKIPDRLDALDTPIDPEDVNSPPSSALAELNEAVPVPVAMSPAEIDERARVIETLEGKRADERR
jgi:hypothetical protein